MNQNKKMNGKNISKDIVMTVGNGLSFEAKEAYKRLRTNIMFSFADVNSCRVIGVTSALRGEGKSTTSANLAYSLAEAGKHTLLLDADMRLPNLYKKLGVKQSPGLSNLLVGLNDGTNLLQSSGLHKDLVIMSSGDIAPNPTELLSSKRMSSILNLLREKFDYIIIDLPPVDLVADALIVSKLVHGMIIVVRQNYADKNVLDNTVRQLKYHEANILGFVLNCTESGDRYYKKNHYKSNKHYKIDSED